MNMREICKIGCREVPGPDKPSRALMFSVWVTRGMAGPVQIPEAGDGYLQTAGNLIQIWKSFIEMC